MPSFFTVPKKRNENAQALNDRITTSPTPQAAAMTIPDSRSGATAASGASEYANRISR